MDEKAGTTDNKSPSPPLNEKADPDLSTSAPDTAPSPALVTLSARPYAYTFPPSSTALLLIDLQRDFVDPCGFGAVQCGDANIFSTVRSVVPRCAAALSAARALSMPIIHTREGHAPDLSDLSAAKRSRQLDSPTGHHTVGIGDRGPMGRLLVRGEYGHDIVDELRPLPGEVVIDKSGKGSFWSTGLHRALMARHVTHILLCGVTTECCVTTTAREAADRGWQCCVLQDCTSGFDAGFVAASLDMICSFDGLFGFVAPSTELRAHASLAASTTPPATPPEWDAESLSLDVLSDLYARGVLSPTRVVEAVYARIRAYADPAVWIYVRPEAQVLQEARDLEARSKPEGRPVLYGIPFAVKDNFDVAGLQTTAACREFAYTATQTARSVELLRDAGALLIGKTNMDQFATGLSGARSPFGTPRSVFGSGKYISGGSSSGSAVAVAAGLAGFALGTDTAGSGRVPAALNGIVGYKPTRGTVSARGVVPACRSLDTVSVFASSVADAERVWRVLDGYDDGDVYAKTPSELPLSLIDHRPPSVAGFRVAVPPESALGVCTASYRAAFEGALSTFRGMGGEVVRLDEAGWEPFAVATELLYNGSLVAERIACIGHGFLVEHLEELHPTTRELLGRVLEGPPTPWDVFVDQARQRAATRQAAELFSRRGGRIDVLVTPTVPCHPTVDEMEADPIALNARMGAFTHFGNVLDLCAVSVAAGLVDDGMPFGVSLVGAMGLDGDLFKMAAMFEQTRARRT